MIRSGGIIIEYILDINNISKNLKNMEVLKNVSFKIPKGSIFAFLGPNGAGKSTLINIIIKLLDPTSGYIDRDYKKIGIVFQENTLDEDLTIYDNLMIRGSLYKIDKNKLKENINKIIELLNMNSFANKKYKELSGGEKRIAMIARSIIINPSILILDEPTTALDPNIRRVVWSTILKLNKENKMTIFFSSHYLEEAYFSNYICILNKGKILFYGKTDKLLNQGGLKKLIIKEKDNYYEKNVNSIKEGLNYINLKDISNITSITLTEPPLEEIFINMTEGDNKLDTN